MFALGNATLISAKELSRTSYFGTSASSASTFLKPPASSPTNSGAKYFLNVSTCLLLNASVATFSKATTAFSLCAVFTCLAGVGAANQVETAVASDTQQIMTCRSIFFKRLHLLVLERFCGDLLHSDGRFLSLCCLYLPGWSRCSKTTRNSRRQCHTTDNDVSFHN